MAQLTRCFLGFLLTLGWMASIQPQLWSQEPAQPPLSVELKQGDQRINVSVAGQAFTTYDYGTYDKPILAPILGPGQVRMTRSWPMNADAKGEATDHPHHKSLWISHEINGIDFWGEKGGRVVTQKVAVEQNPVPMIRSESAWVRKSDDQQILTDQTTFWFGGDRDRRWIECEIELRATHGDVTMDDTKEGFFAIRTHPDLRLKAAPKAGVRKVFGTARNSEGVEGKSVWGKPAKWMLYQGPIDGQAMSIAIFDHPKNLRHPTTWHARDYGLVAANPFGLHHFLGKEKGAGACTIPQGDSLRLRYRIEFLKGLVEPETVEQHFQAFAQTKVN